MRRYNGRIQEIISKSYSDGLRYLVGYYDRDETGQDCYRLIAAFDCLPEAEFFIENYDGEPQMEILNNYDDDEQENS